jgi:hypothetical protein
MAACVYIHLSPSLPLIRPPAPPLPGPSPCFQASPHSTIRHPMFPSPFSQPTGALSHAFPVNRPPPSFPGPFSYLFGRYTVTRGPFVYVDHDILEDAPCGFLEGFSSSAPASSSIHPFSWQLSGPHAGDPIPAHARCALNSGPDALAPSSQSLPIGTTWINEQTGEQHVLMADGRWRSLSSEPKSQHVITNTPWVANLSNQISGGPHISHIPSFFDLYGTR